MKATIITFHCTPNYGATLQSVAMFKLFSQYFDNVELLDYRPKKITNNYNYIYWKRLRGFVASLLNVPTNFEQSINELSNNHYKKENTSLVVKFMIRVSNKMQRVLKK